MRRKFRNFLNKNLFFLDCLIFISLFIFMSNGYSILNSKLNLKASASIVEDDLWLPEVSFQKTMNYGNYFFYDVIINNTSKSSCKDWKVMMSNADYIGFTDMLGRRKMF